MAKKLLCYLIFLILETLIILGSIVVVVCLYLPFVVLKGIVMTATGKATRNEQVISDANPALVLAFGEDANGEVYYFLETANAQGIYRFERAE